ncbi:testicular spindle-associated protein SHCBP1L-like [Sceloporus undulatus]|uniref:testicular spindle-associated protein SHCBP1L-like n=1 Tax=Sceloporus undulatus TaxID=8520 RepID=UPI001C4BC3CF|nr:testicular spindle-associated protein SHCBP1L-like [Sceloporus undulatus]
MASSSPQSQQEEGGGRGGSPEEEETHPLPLKFPSYLGALSRREMVELYCDCILQGCQAEDARRTMGNYILEKMKMKEKWLGIWETNPDTFFTSSEEIPVPNVGVLVEVTCKVFEYFCPNRKVSVSIAEPFSSNIANIPRAFIDNFLEKKDHYVPLSEIYPVQGQDSAVSDIAKALEIVRFFYDFLWREWDDDENSETYAARIEERIKIWCDINNGSIPAPFAHRFRRNLEKCKSKHFEMIYYPNHIEEVPTREENIEYFKKYFEVRMLRGLLKIWEDLRLRVHGPLFRRILKRRKGYREDRKPITYIVAKTVTVEMYVQVKDFSSNAFIEQCDNLNSALDSCYSGDHILIFPGEYKAARLSMLTEDIIIKGAGRPEEIIITSELHHESFVVSRAQNVKLTNITLIQQGTLDGIVVVESGHTALENCVLKCQGTGICVFAGASLTVINSEITGAEGAGIELYPGSTAILEGNNIHHCNNFRTCDPSGGNLGGINIKVLPLPKLRMKNNHIHSNNGYGVTIMKPCEEFSATTEGTVACAAAGDGEESLSKLMQELSLDMSTNILEENAKAITIIN